MATTIVTKNGSGAPTASDLVAGELAVDLTNGRLYTTDLDSGGTVIEIGLNPSGNVDVTGSVTADGLTVDGTATIDGASGIPLTLDADAGANTNLQFSENGSLRWYLRSVTSSNDFNFYGNSQNRLNIGSGGDISFYDTLGNAKFFWDASAESLGIGTSPDYPLHVSSTGVVLGLNATSGAVSQRFNENGTARFFLSTLNGSNGLAFVNGDGVSERMRIDSSGTVKISHADTASEGLRVIQTTAARTSGGALGVFYDDQAGTTQPTLKVIQNGTGDILQLFDGGSQVVTVKDGGNLLVGKTTLDNTTAGIVLYGQSAGKGAGSFVRDGGVSLIANRLTSDGTIQEFFKDGALVGSIGTYSGDFWIGQGNTGLLFNDGSDVLRPANASGGNRDGNYDLGASDSRFKDLYRSGSTISTSDRNMKQDERDLTEAETRVAQACKGLLKAFRFIDAVEVDGDDARIHFGIIAQDLQAAFEAEGLDATKYAMFRPSTFTDDEGNEQARLGVCYENLLAFIIAAI